MERLTMRDDKGTAFWVDQRCCGGGYRRPEDRVDQERLDRLADYEDTGLTPEDFKRVEWICRPINWTGCDLEKTIEEVEKALGFKLFFWQKTYILFGKFRQLGATTAEILRDLLNVSEEPIDYSRRPKNEQEKFYRWELWEIKTKLDAAGISTRTVLFSERDRRAWFWARRDKP